MKKLLENWNSAKHTKYETIEFNRCKIILSKCSQFLNVYLLFLYLLGCELLTVFRQALVWVQRPGIGWVQISGFATWAKHWNLSFNICQIELITVPASSFEVIQLRHWKGVVPRGKHLTSRSLLYDDLKSCFLADLLEKPILARRLTADRKI